MSGRKICCCQCGKDMGELAEGSRVRVGMEVICAPCKIIVDESLKQLKLIRAASAAENFRKASKPFSNDWLDDILGKGKGY